MKPTKKQLELLQALNPYKERAVTYEEAAKILGLGLQAVKDRMLRLKWRCPNIYADFRTIRKIMNQGQQNISNAKASDPSDFDWKRIIERF